ncbi:MAG: glutamine synthetase family protein [Promethearchaeota archaeon]
MIEKTDPKRKEACEKVIETVKEENIKFIYLQFTDIHGIIKSFEINAKRIEDFLEEGENFDGSSITGYGAIEESDKVAIPDPSTFYMLPWRKNNKVARFICDIYKPDGDKYEGDPRYILQKAVKKAEAEGLTFYCAPEMEFFILNKDGKEIYKPSDMRGYFDYDPYDINEQMRYTIAEYCDAMGIEIEALHHEVAFGQHEVDFKYDKAVDSADNTITIKTIIKTVAAQNDMTATFMPKPFPGINGSGMHVHQSLWKDDKNLFYDEKDKANISLTMKKWISGQLKHAKAMCCVLSSWPNSYKRLVPGYEAPVYIAWGFRNRSPLIRVPDFHGRPNAARNEIRCPDPAGNPYLQFAVLLSAGLDGVLSDDIEIVEPTDKNVYHFSTKDLEKSGINALPGSLRQALVEFKGSDFMKEVFGEETFKNYYYAKLEEFDAYRISVSQWERDRYITRL